MRKLNSLLFVVFVSACAGFGRSSEPSPGMLIERLPFGHSQGAIEHIRTDKFSCESNSVTVSSQKLRAQPRGLDLVSISIGNVSVSAPDIAAINQRLKDVGWYESIALVDCSVEAEGALMQLRIEALSLDEEKARYDLVPIKLVLNGDGTIYSIE